MSRKTFGKEELDAALGAIGVSLKKPITCYLIGGAAMTFRGQKVATKDIDLVVVGQGNLDRIRKSMDAAGFSKVPELEREYAELGARVVMENADGMRFDLFEGVVCRKLAFSVKMQTRTEEYGSFGNLRVRLTSAEDIFLFKGVTDRPDDLDDMSVLATGGLEWDIVKEECLAQESGRNWSSHLVAKLEQLDDQYNIKAPIEEELREWAQVQAMGAVVSEFLRGSSSSFEEIHKHLGNQYGFTQKDTETELSRLVKHGILRVEKRGTKQLYRES